LEKSPELRAFRTAWWQRLLDEPATYELTRFAILRLLGLVYLVAFLSLALQLEPLLGSHGLLPAAQFLAAKREQLGASAYWRIPTVFWLAASDTVLRGAAWCGVLLAGVALAGATNAALQVALWGLYLSFVHIGQIFYGYGWEIQLLETGLLAAFFCPLRSLRALPQSSTPTIVVWLFRWLVFRVMVGAALIKLRNDPCWRDLSCLDYHFETQPNPNALSWSLHHAPHWLHVVGVLFNHFVELVVPWFAFGFALRPWRHAAGVLLVALQVVLILSGNLSFLNWLTIVPALACFDDSAFLRFVPARWRSHLLARLQAAAPSRVHTRATQVLGLVIGLLSIAPVVNLVSCDQEMNRSFEPLAIVNTYGAFGSIDRERFEVLLEGSDERGRADAWHEYELPCMPGDPRRRPCLVTPYHYRLDWQMWFVGNGAARGEPIEDEPWLVHLIWQLLRGEPEPKRLLARDPFAQTPPRWIRAGLWRYRFSDSRRDGTWWTRQRVGEVLPPVSAEDPGLREYVRAFKWPDAPSDDSP